MTAKVKIGVIGVGKMGMFHLAKYAAIPEVDIVGIYDVNSNQVSQAKQRFGVRAFGSLSELLFEVDAVSIASPTSTHLPIARQALDSGVHVLIEKPIAETESQAEEIVRLGREKKLVVQVGFIERFRFHALTRSVPIGTVRFIEGNRLSASLGRDLDIDVVSDLMIHDLDLALAIIGEEPSQVSAIGMPVLTTRCDIANVRLEFPGGAVVNLTASRVSAKPFRKLRLFSSSSYLSMDLIANRVEASFRNNSGGLQTQTFESSPLDALHEQCLDFLEAVRGQKSPLVTGEDGLRALRVAERIRVKIAERSEKFQSQGHPREESRSI